MPDPRVEAALQAAYAEGAWGKYHGGHVEELERRLAEYHGVEGALTCSSGTVAVELALRGLKIGPGDEVLLAAYDYPGVFLSVHATGARPVLVDVLSANWNLNIKALEAALSSASRAIIASHLHGGMVRMRLLMQFADAKGLRVVEDAAQAPGARVDGRPAGSWGDVGVLSFGGSKLLTGGRGGAVLARHAEVLQRVRTWTFRGNHYCPLSELQAAVLLPQLEQLDERNRQRLRGVGLLRELLSDVSGLRPFDNQVADSQPAYYKVGFQFDAAAFGLSRERFVAAMRAEGIALDEGFRALHVGRSPQRFRKVGNLAEAERAHAGCVILHHPILLGNEDDIGQVATAIRKIHAHADRLAQP